MSKEKTAFHAMAEYSARLGIPAKDVLTSRGELRIFYPKTRRLRRNLGLHHGTHVQVKTTKRQAIDIKETVAHELIHDAFPTVRHGIQFEKHVEALQDGFMFFSGATKKNAGHRMKVVRIDEHGQKWWASDPSQPYDEIVTSLITKMPKKPIPENKKLEMIQDHIKLLESRIKRLGTHLRKWKRREKYYLKKVNENA